jgi:hypothetical protein
MYQSFDVAILKFASYQTMTRFEFTIELFRCVIGRVFSFVPKSLKKQHFDPCSAFFAISHRKQSKSTEPGPNTFIVRQ